MDSKVKDKISNIESLLKKINEGKHSESSLLNDSKSLLTNILNELKDPVEETVESLNKYGHTSNQLLSVHTPGKTLYISNAWQTVLQENLVTLQNFRADEVFHPESAAIFKNSVEEVISKHCNVITVELRLKDKDGVQIWLKSDFKEILFDNKPAVLIVSHNITEYKGLQKELEDSAANLLSQIETTEDRIWSVDRNMRIKTINTNFQRDFEKAFAVKLEIGSNVVDALPSPVKEVWNGRYHRALSGEHYSVVDSFEYEGVPKHMEVTFNPIRIKDEIIGVSCFSHDITIQKESEEKFRLLSEISPNAISIVTVEKYLYVNKAWENQTGYTKKEAFQNSPAMIIPPTERDRRLMVYHAIIESESEYSRSIHTIKTRSGETKTLDISLKAINFEQQKALLVASNDITKITSLQKKLEESAANLTSLLENTPDRIWSIDTEKNIITLNKNFKRDFQIAFNVELSSGVSAIQYLPEPLLSEWTSRYNRALQGEQFLLVDEFKYEGIPQYTETSFNPIWLDDKIVGVSCYSRDISEQKRNELKIIESEQRYKTLVSNIPSVTYRCAADKHWTMEFISDEIYTLSGYTANEFISNKVRSYASIIHPNDRLIVERVVQEGIDNKTFFDIDYSIIHKDGSIRYVSERGRPYFDESDNFIWLDGVISDVTDKIKAKRELRKNEELYRTIFNSIQDIFLRSYIDGKIELISPAVEKILEYKPEELLGKTILDLYVHPHEREKLIIQLSKKGVVNEFEIELRAKNGGIKTIALNARLTDATNDSPSKIEGLLRDITYRKVAEKALQDRTRELDSIFENAPVILILVDSDLSILNFNKTSSKGINPDSSKYLGILASQVIKCISGEIENLDKNPECGGHIVKSTIEKTFAEKANQYQVEGTIYITVNGEYLKRNFLISTIYIEHNRNANVLLSLDDITEIREAEYKIRRLSTAVEQSTATVVITDTRGNIEYVNPQFEKTTGYTAEEALGKNPSILKSEHTSSQDYEELWETIVKGDTWTGEFLNKRKDGSTYWENAIISPIFDASGKVFSYLAIKENITEKKQIQEDLIKSEQELRLNNEQKNRFISILAHDLRGLVGNFHVIADLFQTHFDAMSATEIKEMIDNLASAASDSLNLLDNLLEWGKATLGNLTVNIKDFYPGAEVRDIQLMLTDLADKKEISLINEIDSDLIIHSDINIFQTIVRNLINNSIKFTPPGGSITVSSKILKNKKVEISVRDTGIGMSKQIKNKLFKLGQTVSSPGTNQERGTGLGLIICNELVRHIGSEIQVESEIGVGSRFYFSLPTAKES